MSFIWLARGYQWGFEFLEEGSQDDDSWNPLTVYEDAFEPFIQQDEFCRRVSPERVALRMKDPEGRKDQAGRFIYHDFVLLADLAEKVDSVEDGVEIIWPLVADRYAEVWDG